MYICSYLCSVTQRSLKVIVEAPVFRDNRQNNINCMMKRIYAFLLSFILALPLLVSCNGQEQEVPVSSVSLSQSTAEMIIGEFVDLTATVLPSNATDKSVTWTSSKKSVATVNDAGRVDAVAEGSSTITASCGGKSAICVVTVSKGVVEVVSISLNKTNLTIVEGETEFLTATVKPDDATDKAVTWSSSDNAIATVSEGNVTAVKKGEAIITATSGDQSATCQVIVSQKVIPVESVELDITSKEVEEGDSFTLTAIIKPDNATNKTVTWSSLSPQVATVDDNGKVTAIAEGNTVIEARAGDKASRCNVTVNKKYIEVTSIEIDNCPSTIEKGESVQLHVTILPDNATDKTVTWSSTDEAVATIDNTGYLTATGSGTAVIYADNGKGLVSSVKITVVISTKNIQLYQTAVELQKGHYVKLNATVTPTDSTEPVVWTSSDNTIATVDDGVVVAVKPGKTTVTASSGNVSASCEVSVIVPAERISLSPSSMQLSVGESKEISLLVEPNDATYGSADWKSSDESVAIYHNGKILGIGKGNAVITAKIGQLEAKCEISVVVNTIGVELDKTSVTLKPGQKIQLNATVLPADASNKDVVWESSDETVAIVDYYGLVQAIQNGSATITVKTKSGSHSAACVIKVGSSGSAGGSHEGTEFEPWE